MSKKSQLLFLFVVVTSFGAAMGMFESVFNNFLADVHGLDAGERGWLEFPRELPGFLVVMFAGALSALAVTRLGVVGASVYVVGTAGLGLWGGSQLGLMIGMMMVSSAGMHLLQPVSHSIAIALSEPHNRGRRLGQIGAVGTIGVVTGAAVVRILFDETNPDYWIWFLGSAAFAMITVATYAKMHVPDLHQGRARLVIRKRFTLYYVLELLFGARKQIFITFGFWVLIRVYGASAADIAGLLMTASLIGIAFKPLTGVAIDRFGERAVLMFDGIALAFVCVGYGYAEAITGDLETARTLACVCFVADNLLFALGSGRSVYVSRLTNSPQEVTSTLAMGVSVNHIASMLIPAIGGFIWETFGYERVFTAAAVLALGIAIVASRVPGRRMKAEG